MCTECGLTQAEFENQGGGGGVGGVDNFRLYVDPVTNQTTMTALGNASLRNIPGKPNFYDPVTKTLSWPNGIDLDAEILHGDFDPSSGAFFSVVSEEIISNL